MLIFTIKVQNICAQNICANYIRNVSLTKYLFKISVQNICSKYLFKISVPTIYHGWEVTTELQLSLNLN